MTDKNFELPTDYDSMVKLVSENKNNAKVLKKTAESLLNKMGNLYDESLSIGPIALSKSEAYSKFFNVDKDQTFVPNAICGTSHQLMADIFNDAGIPARVIRCVALRPNMQGGAHYALIYSPKEGEYIVSDWNTSVGVKAKDMVEATEKAFAEHPTLASTGYTTILTNDGKHIAYNEFSAGKLLLENPDVNSTESLNGVFNTVDSKKGVDLKVGGTNGDDPIYGKYQSENVILKGNYSLGKEDKIQNKLGLNCSYSHLKTTKDINVDNPPEALYLDVDGKANKECNYKILDIKVNNVLTTPALTNKTSVDDKTPKFSLKGFVGCSYNFMEDKIKAETNFGTKELNKVWEKEDNRLGGQYSKELKNVELYSAESKRKNIVFGGSVGTEAKIESKDGNLDVMLNAGKRFQNDRGVYNKKYRYLSQTVLGANLKGDYGKGDMKVSGNASAFKVEADNYTKKVLSGEATLSQTEGKGTLSATLGGNKEAVKISELPEEHAHENVYGRLGYSLKLNEKTKFDIDVQKDAKNVKDLVLSKNVDNLRLGVKIGLNF